MLARLEDELRFAPRERILQAVERIELLAPDIEPDTVYPDEWVVHRITGYRPEKPAGDLVGGHALLAGLSPLCERLCHRASLALREVTGGIPPAALKARLHISTQTLTRLRRQGLIARRVADDQGRTTLIFRESVIRVFEQRHAAALTKAARFTQLSPRERHRAIAAARRYRRWAGLSTQAAAQRIALKLGRATETIRQLLAREGQGATRAGRDLSPKAIWRAWRWGATPKDLARALRRSPSVVRRDISLARRAHLLAALPRLETPPHLHDPSLLDSPAALLDLGQAPPATLEQLFALARATKPPVATEERSRLACFHTLRHRAATHTTRVSPLQPQPRSLDHIETDLRWAARLAAALVLSQLRTIVSTLEVRLEQPLDDLPARVAQHILLHTLAAAAHALESIDPAKGGRVAGPVGLAADRVGARLAQHIVASPKGRARALDPTPMPDWTLRLFPWQRRIEPDPRLRAALLAGHLPAGTRSLLAARFGLDGAGPPRTLTDLAREMKQSERALSLELPRALAAALAPFRGPAYPASPGPRAPRTLPS